MKCKLKVQLRQLEEPSMGTLHPREARHNHRHNYLTCKHKWLQADAGVLPNVLTRRRMDRQWHSKA
jgi:hypothetical protein